MNYPLSQAPYSHYYQDPKQRPTFIEICAIIDKLVAEHAPHIPIPHKMRNMAKSADAIFPANSAPAAGGDAAKKEPKKVGAATFVKSLQTPNPIFAICMHKERSMFYSDLFCGSDEYFSLDCPRYRSKSPSSSRRCRTRNSISPYHSHRRSSQISQRPHTIKSGAPQGTPNTSTQPKPQFCTPSASLLNQRSYQQRQGRTSTAQYERIVRLGC